MINIFDVFGFKKQAQEVFTKKNFSDLMATVKEAIITQVKANIPGVEKKAIVDALVIAKIDDFAAGISNKIVLYLIGMIKQGIPTVTQIAYDFLKEKVESL